MRHEFNYSTKLPDKIEYKEPTRIPETIGITVAILLCLLYLIPLLRRCWSDWLEVWRKAAPKPPKRKHNEET